MDTITQSAKLVMIEGPRGDATFWLDKPRLVVGRDPRSDLVIDHPEVSRRHALITRVENGWLIQDLESTNGTFVNGQPAVEPRLLAWGDTIDLGTEVTLELQRAQAHSTASQELRPISAPSAPPQPAQAEPSSGGDRGGQELAPPSGGSLSLEDPVDQQRSDLTLVWIVAGFVVLLSVAACAAAMILAYLGLLSVPF